MPERVVLRVAEAPQSDVGLGRARVDTKTRVALGVDVGEIIEIVGKKSTAAKLFRVMQEDEGKGILRIDGLVRRNVGVSLGDKVEVRKAEVFPGERVTIAPIISEGHKISFGQGIENFVKRGLLKRPVNKGDVVIVPGIALMGGALPFMVIKSQPKGIVQIHDETIIEMKEEPVREGEVLTPTVTYEDIGGLKEELMKVREMIELPLKHAELFERLGIDPPKGVLLYGPPGTGKTLIAKAVANEAGANFYSIQGPEIMSKYYGQSEERLREKFDEAQKNAPSVLFIDELDSIAPKREEVTGEVERRVVAQLLTLMDGLSARGQVIVIGATNRDEAIDPALRRPGRFDREIEIGVPDRDGRKEVVQIHTRGMPIEGSEEDRDRILSELADVTHGFVGADLAALAREAAMKALRRYLPELDLDKPIPSETLERMRVTAEDFKNALKEVEPSAMREVLVEIPRITWADVGGLQEIKLKLREAVEMPLKDPESFRRMGIRPPRGVLLSGPPGSGKTLLAKAVATESEANFISIKGPEVMSKWVGESEKAVRMIFKKAKQVAPCIVFLDELDAIAHRRGFDNDSGVSERVVNQLLTSMDGLETLEGVVVIGATNRPDMVDPALLRTGRFDRILLVPAPDKTARLEILRVHTKDMPLENVDLEELAVELEGYTGADIEGLCREAAMIALRENRRAKKVGIVHFQEATKSIPPSLDADTIKFYEEIGRRLERGVVRRRREEPQPQYI
jgi:transitional endoplasmic reticulum ATPase